MKSKNARVAVAAIVTIMLAATLGISQSRAKSPCDQITKILEDGQIAIILNKDPIVSADPAGMLKQVTVCSYRGSVGDTGEAMPCNLCRLPVEQCREKLDAYCKGTIDATINSSLGLNLNWTRTTHSPDLCCKQICIDGACKNQCWPC